MLRNASLLLCTLLLAACGNDASGALINAAEGGTVSSSTADIVIPAASLAEDTEVMIARGDTEALPPLEGVRVIVDLQPQGTVLETPASVTISGTEIGAGEGERIAAYQLLDGWLPMEYQTGPNGDVTVAVSRFQPVAITVSEAPSGGTIDGTISWGNGDPAGMAPIELWMGDTMVSTTNSDEAGAFQFTELESGTYTLRVNYECMLEESVGVAAGATETVTLTLCGG